MHNRMIAICTPKKQILIGFLFIITQIARSHSLGVFRSPYTNSRITEQSRSAFSCELLTVQLDATKTGNIEQDLDTDSLFPYGNGEADALRHRRKLLFQLLPSCLTAISLIPSTGHAIEANDHQEQKIPITSKGINRPYTPTIEPLIPMIYINMQLLLIQKLVDELNSVLSANENAEDSFQIVNQIKTYLEEPSSNFDQRPLFTTSSKMKEKYNNERKMIESKFTMKPRSKSLNSHSSPMIPLSGLWARYACNMYTANLRYGDSYVLTADPAVRKAMIRNDALPDIKTVIKSDLDLRDLYRNQLQTSIDDLQAELYSTNPDPVEVQELVHTAIDAMQTWLNLVRPQDINLAQDILQKQILPQLYSTEYKSNEKKLLKLPDPYQLY